MDMMSNHLQKQGAEVKLIWEKQPLDRRWPQSHCPTGQMWLEAILKLGGDIEASPCQIFLFL